MWLREYSNRFRLLSHLLECSCNSSVLLTTFYLLLIGLSDELLLVDSLPLPGHLLLIDDIHALQLVPLADLTGILEIGQVETLLTLSAVPLLLSDLLLLEGYFIVEFIVLVDIGIQQ